MKQQAYTPKMSDVAVTAKTGKDWKSWFAILDRAGARKLAHRDIAQLLHDRHGMPAWWCQMVTVEYERARGLRNKHERPDGYSVSVSKTVASDVPALFAAVADAEKRKNWFPQGALEITSQIQNKSLRGKWNGAQRVDFGFYPKGQGRAQIAVQISKLPDKKALERERAAWKRAMGKLGVAQHERPRPGPRGRISLTSRPPGATSSQPRGARKAS